MLPVGPTIDTTDGDLALASIALGFTIGFGYLVVWEAYKQTVSMKHPLRSMYIFLVWVEILSDIGFATMAYLLLTENVEATFAVIFVILCFWTIQTQFLIQIIVNRISVILPETSKRKWLKIGTIVLWGMINVSAFCIWLPARLGVSKTYTKVNFVWDRLEKCFYMIIDCILNWYFIELVKKRLVRQGSQKYDRLVKFNTRIIFVSIAMDILLIGLMNVRNNSVYLQIHPLTFIVKLNIELTMADLIRKIVAEKIGVDSSSDMFGTYQLTITGGKQGTQQQNTTVQPEHGVMVSKSVVVQSRAADDIDQPRSGTATTDGSSAEERHEQRRQPEDDEIPLRH